MAVILDILYWSMVVLFLGTAAYGAYTDVRTMEIPNWVSGLIAVLYLPAGLAAGTDIADIAIHYGVGVGLLALGALLFSRGVIGGGDAKLLAACGVWMGLWGFADFLILMAVAGGALAVIVLAWRSRVEDGESHPLPWLDKSENGIAGLPYGVSIAVAASLMVLFRPVLP